MLTIRPYQPDDRPFIESQAQRLLNGMPAWRDHEACLRAIKSWIEESLANHGESVMVFVASDADGERLGFASVTGSTHFNGRRQAYIGELVTAEAAEGRGVGRALVDACEEWARAQGFDAITLTTGAANQRALGFYAHLGFRAEEVKLVKRL